MLMFVAFDGSDWVLPDGPILKGKCRPINGLRGAASTGWAGTLYRIRYF